MIGSLDAVALSCTALAAEGTFQAYSLENLKNRRSFEHSEHISILDCNRSPFDILTGFAMFAATFNRFEANLVCIRAAGDHRLACLYLEAPLSVEFWRTSVSACCAISTLKVSDVKTTQVKSVHHLQNSTCGWDQVFSHGISPGPGRASSKQ